MSDGTKIEWTEATWNIVTGCSVHSPGCTNCYAMKLAGTRLQHHRSRAGLTVPSKAGPVWSGEVRFNDQWLDQPLRWRRPRRIFVCAHGDLFHESVPDAWLDKVFAVMALCPQHNFQVLTKRSARMRQYLNNFTIPLMDGFEQWLGSALKGRNPFAHWPLPNVWMGVSVEDQERADERIPDLMATPAAVRWLSCEPLLGPIDFRCVPGFNRIGYDLSRWWVVVGGESGDGARPMHPAWPRLLRDLCGNARVPFFFKQWGLHLPAGQVNGLGRQWGTEGQTPQFMLGTKAITGRQLDGQFHDANPLDAASRPPEHVS